MSIYQKLFDIQGLSVKKDASNPFFKCKYATLDKIMELLAPILQENKWLITHVCKAGSLTTTLKDLEHNEEIVSSIHLPDIQDPQKIGSAITYFRRYNLVQIFNLLTEEDDDGNKASGNVKKEYPKTVSQVQEDVGGGKCPECSGVILFKEGTSKAGKPYKGNFCQNKDCDYKEWIN